MMDLSFRKAGRILLEEEFIAGLRPGDLQSRLRTRTIATAKKKAISRIRAETKLSWREIGIILGYKDRPSSNYRRKT